MLGVGHLLLEKLDMLTLAIWLAVLLLSGLPFATGCVVVEEESEK